MKGGLGFTGQSPSAACRSVWQTPEASILTRIWPGRTSGTGTSSIDSGFLNWCTTAAFIVLAIAPLSLGGVESDPDQIPHGRDAVDRPHDVRPHIVDVRAEPQSLLVDAAIPNSCTRHRQRASGSPSESR